MDESRLIEWMEQYAREPGEETLSLLIEGYAPLCAAIARRFTGRGVEFEDLNQVALMALVKAIERFEPERGLKFTTYATPTIAGEIRHYIRDRGSSIRFSRDKTEKLNQLARVRERLTIQLQREPSVNELAKEMEMAAYELLALLRMQEASTAFSMDQALSAEEETALSQRLGQLDSGFQAVEDRDELERLLKIITPQEKKLLELRFVDRLGQRETAKQLNISQMQVSRIERRVLERLRSAAS